MKKLYETTEAEIELQAARQRISAMNVRIRQQEEQHHSKEQNLQAEITRLLHVEESARRLCTLILSKDRGEMRLGEDYTWNSVNSEELIRRTTDSYIAYCKRRVENLQTLKDFAMSKSDCLERAEETISKLKEANEQLMAHGATPQAQKIIRDMIQEDDIALKEAYSRGKLIIEDCEEGREELAKQAVALRTDTVSREETDAAYKKQMRSSGKRSEAEIIAERKAIDTVLDETRILTNMLTDNAKNVIRKLGEGMSVAVEIRNSLDSPAKTFSEAHRLLASKNLVATETQVRFPGSTNPNIVWLTLTGKQAYKLLTGEYPQMAECEKLKKFHATMEHGYGIRSCYRLLKESNRYEKLDMFAAPINLYNGNKYQPDILGLVKTETGEDDVEYFEYERVRQTQEDYNAKFNKMALIMDEINVIVGNATEHGKMQEYMYNWAKHHKDMPEYSGKVLRLTSFTTLQARIEGKMEFEQWWHISAHLASFPAAGEK